MLFVLELQVRLRTARSGYLVPRGIGPAAGESMTVERRPNRGYRLASNPARPLYASGNRMPRNAGCQATSAIELAPVVPPAPLPVASGNLAAATTLGECTRLLDAALSRKVPFLIEARI